MLKSADLTSSDEQSVGTGAALPHGRFGALGSASLGSGDVEHESTVASTAVLVQYGSIELGAVSANSSDEQCERTKEAATGVVQTGFEAGGTGGWRSTGGEGEGVLEADLEEQRWERRHARGGRQLGVREAHGEGGRVPATAAWCL